MGVCNPVLRRALFGAPLEGHSPLRYIYVDEAGTSAKEPVTVVVGIILNADEHYGPAEDDLARIIATVPEPLRKGFISHAKEIWNDTTIREHWEKEDRLAFLKDLMGLPQRLQIPVTVAMVRRNAPPVLPRLKNLVGSKRQHVEAFGHCIARADKYIRDNAGPKEVATVVAEDVPEMRKFLRLAVKSIQESPFLIHPQSLQPTKREKQQGALTQQALVQVSRVRDVVHFAEKSEGSLLQVADAIAWGFRRYFSGQSHGEEFLHSILPPGRLVPEDWEGPASFSTFFWESKWFPFTAPLPKR